MQLCVDCGSCGYCRVVLWEVVTSLLPSHGPPAGAARGSHTVMNWHYTTLLQGGRFTIWASNAEYHGNELVYTTHIYMLLDCPVR